MEAPSVMGTTPTPCVRMDARQAMPAAIVTSSNEEVSAMTVSAPDVLAEIQAGEGLSLSAAGKQFPGHRGGSHIDPSTIFRWVTRGTRTPSGAVVKLGAIRLGQRWLTSRAAVARFVEALTASCQSDETSSPPSPRSPSNRRRAADAAGEVLAWSSPVRNGRTSETCPGSP